MVCWSVFLLTISILSSLIDCEHRNSNTTHRTAFKNPDWQNTIELGCQSCFDKTLLGEIVPLDASNLTYAQLNFAAIENSNDSAQTKTVRTCALGRFTVFLVWFSRLNPCSLWIEIPMADCFFPSSLGWILPKWKRIHKGGGGSGGGAV